MLTGLIFGGGNHVILRSRVSYAEFAGTIPFKIKVFIFCREVMSR